jgi:hypothetical protein
MRKWLMNSDEICFANLSGGVGLGGEGQPLTAPNTSLQVHSPAVGWKVTMYSSFSSVSQIYIAGISELEPAVCKAMPYHAIIAPVSSSFPTPNVVDGGANQRVAGYVPRAVFP